MAFRWWGLGAEPKSAFYLGIDKEEEGE